MSTGKPLILEPITGKIVSTEGQLSRLYTNAYWNGERDYSFMQSETNGEYHISTPAQYAALCYITGGQWACDATCPSYITSSSDFSGKNILMDNDLIFNEDYENNKNWIDLYSSAGHVHPPANDCTWLRLVNFAGTLDGQLHSIKGLYYHQANESAASYGSGVLWNTLGSTATIRDLYIENCSLKNFKQGQFCCFYVQPGAKIYNVQVRNCRLVGVTKTAGGMGSVQFGIIAATWTISNIDMHGCGIVNTDAMLYDSTGYSSYRENGLHLAGWTGNVPIYNCFNADVNLVSSSSQYAFEKYGTLNNCISYNATGVSSQGISVSSIDELVSRHNSYNDSLSRQINADLRYI